MNKGDFGSCLWRIIGVEAAPVSVAAFRACNILPGTCRMYDARRTEGFIAQKFSSNLIYRFAKTLFSTTTWSVLATTFGVMALSS